MALVKKEIGELLVENGLISPEQWQEVQLEREKTGEPVSIILSRLGLASENQVKNALELQYGVNYLALSRIEPPAIECMQMLPEAVMRQHQLVPVTKDGNRITIAMVNPNNLVALDDIKMRLKGMQVKLSVCTEDDFQSFMETIYSKHLQSQKSDDESEADKFINEDVDLSQMDVLNDIDENMSEQDIEKQASDAPIVMLANQILAKAIKGKISDIHIEPHEKEVAIRFRRDGVLQLDRKLPKPILPALVSRYKVMADLDIAERRLPQDGRIRVRLSGRDIDFRVSTLPAKFGEKVVMRILDKSNTSIGLNKLITDADAMATIMDMISKPYGIIFVTGPTGSGKTTTLYSALAERNSPDVNIVTAEDPIEYDMSGITQVQVIREKGMDFARILRAFLRQDPDIMLVGETRDKETAKIAVEAALTGHLVFTTLHTNDAPGAVTRLEEMEVEPFLISSATIGVVAQRLLRRSCGECKEEYLPERNLLEYLGLLDKNQENLADSTIQFYKFNVNNKGWPIFYRGKGCENCNGGGYRGRVGCYEVMRLNDEIRDLISKGASTAMIRFAAKQAGMVPLKEYSLRLVAQGLTTPEECIRVTISDTAGNEKLCPKCRNPIGDDFIKCPFCQHELKVSCQRCGTLQDDSWASCAKCGLSHEEAKLDHVCPGCEAEVYGSWQRCPYCQTERDFSKTNKTSS
ncbi:MAG: Flp pilus assembly complex ATPase component TadA [Candidatus Obscuribacterales bacterium]|nr:Flp pilus assembly complex ATPase component TadA [Candidatus Obscuribacterales bacterium]